MAIPSTVMSESRIMEPHTPLLGTVKEEVNGYVDYKGYPLKQPKSGGWRSASFLLAGGSLERFAYRGVEANIISYLTGPIGESVAAAAANVNTWIGVVSLVPVLGAYLADSLLGRYRSIMIASILYILKILQGLGLLSLSATIIPTYVSSSSYQGITKKSGPDTGIRVLFYFSLYLVALAQGYKACVQALGADQFDGKHPEQSKARSSFFNWWICGLCIGATAAHLILHYIQDNINWGIGFGIPCLAMILGLVLFLRGSRTYCFPVKRGDEESPYGRVKLSLAKVDDTFHNGALASSSQEECQQDLWLNTQQRSQDHKFLKDVFPAADDHSTANIALSIKTNEPKNVLRLLPIWITCLTYTIQYAQASTLFVKQATTLDKSIGPNFNIPAATLATFITVTIMFCVPIYDQIFVPIARRITKYPTGITMLQRIGLGMGISVINMVVAALVEMKRLKTAQDFGLVDNPNATLPMSFWWLVPQYILFGLADVFNQVGMQEFFYDQVPIEIRSVGLSFYYGSLGIGNFLSSFLVSMIHKATSQRGRESWFSDNLNHAHIDYFYWLLAGIGTVGLGVFVYLSKSYNYGEQNDKNKCSQAGLAGSPIGNSEEFTSLPSMFV